MNINLNYWSQVKRHNHSSSIARSAPCSGGSDRLAPPRHAIRITLSPTCTCIRYTNGPLPLRSLIAMYRAVLGTGFLLLLLLIMGREWTTPSFAGHVRRARERRRSAGRLYFSRDVVTKTCFKAARNAQHAVSLLYRREAEGITHRDI